jgi:3-methyladenine DNA glycosylase AlkD
MTEIVKQIQSELEMLSNKEQALNLQRFFKTGIGEYGEGDKFLGIKVPVLHKVSMKYFRDFTLQNIESLLEANIHEYRFVALAMLLQKYKKAKDIKDKSLYYDFYMEHTKYINNWDLVDLTAPRLSGDYILKFDLKEKEKLYAFANSENLWQRRIAVLSTFAFIREGELDDVFKLSEILLTDKRDLMHKAVGWMLREAGKKDNLRLKKFLNKYASKMPRTMLRYSIEKFAEEERKIYLNIGKTNIIKLS